MRKINTLLALTLIVVLASCASNKYVWTPVGNWEYTVSDTPNGDTFGTMIVTEDEGVRVGKLRSPEYGDANIENFNIDENNQLTGKFSMAGMDMDIFGNFEGETFAGTIDAGYNGSFPMVANRQVDQ